MNNDLSIKWTPTRNKFLEMDSLPRLNQEEIENMKRPISSNEVESEENPEKQKNPTKQTNKKQLPTNESPGPEVFTGSFCQTFKS